MNLAFHPAIFSSRFLSAEVQASVVSLPVSAASFDHPLAVAA